MPGAKVRFQRIACHRQRGFDRLPAKNRRSASFAA
jgi:hypothetical protein